jgi:O-antigen/teichoic acid export membrane protein
VSLVALAAGSTAAMMVGILVLTPLWSVTAPRWAADLPLPQHCGPLLIAAVATMSLYQIGGAWATRTADFPRLAKMRVTYVVTVVVAQLGLGLAFAAGAVGLILGQILGYAVAGATVLWLARHDFALHRARRPRVLRLVAHRYRNYPYFDVWAGLSAHLGILAPPVLLAFAYDPRVAGWYTLAQRILHTPLTMVGYSLSRVYYSDIARIGPARSAELRAEFRRTLRRVCVCVVPWAMLAALLAPFVFEPVFGAGWREAGVCLSLLAPMIAAFVASNVVAPTLDVIGRQRLKLIREIVSVTLIAAGILGARLLGYSPLAAVAAMSGLGTVGYLAAVAIAWQALANRQHDRGASTDQHRRLAA